MDVNYVRELSEIFEKMGLTKMEVCEGEKKISFEKNLSNQSSGFPILQSLHSEVGHKPFTSQENEDKKEDKKDTSFNNLKEVKSPMVGVFYSAPSPDADFFVTVGSKVKKGDVLCIVEAMKLMNEITAEVEGEIVDICVQNGQVVEYSQTLFKIV
ncbi:MAG: acetyl-CoA carboxylase biotin carboxyl carrier protein [Vallitaleaceae bacterium]|nr:acetyl-CoA carboxylase biotin carboxyl carrier protein [Vallitaleaceae bacterium]